MLIACGNKYFILMLISIRKDQIFAKKSLDIGTDKLKIYGHIRRYLYPKEKMRHNFAQQQTLTEKKIDIPRIPV